MRSAHVASNCGISNVISHYSRPRLADRSILTNIASNWWLLCSYVGIEAVKRPLRVEMEGEKKYSPPFDSTHRLSNDNRFVTSSSSWPLISLLLAELNKSSWPIRGSIPGEIVVPGGKLGLFAQTTQAY